MKKTPLLLLGGLVLMIQGGVLPAAAEGMGQTITVRRAALKDVNLDWMLDHATLFTATREDFEKQYEKGSYMWLDKEKSRARFNPDRATIKLRGTDVGETIVSFQEGKVSGVMISVVNKGDDGLIKDSQYKAAINVAKKELKDIAKVAESPRRKNETISKAEGLVWSTKKALYMLEYLWVPEEIRDGWRWYAHGEFVRIKIQPPQVLLGVQQNTIKVNISGPTLAKRVKKDGSKVILEGVPMVDQGSKGYCAVASFERVMRYYGSMVDMHDLAELANTSSMGTSPAGIKDAVHKMAVRSGLRTREPIFMEYKQFVSMKNAYNREAKKKAMGEAGLDSGLVELYREMDPDLFKEMRVKDAGYGKFTSEVARSINAGIPVMWALQLGMFWEDKLEDSYEANRDNPDGDSSEKPSTDEEPEPSRPKRPPESMSGGHMRLIIGYDAKEKLIYYTDSWGPGHEVKKMNVEEAWAVTMGLFILEP